MLIDLKCIRSILLTAEDYRTDNYDDFPSESYNNHVTYMIGKGLILKSERLLDHHVDYNKYLIGELTANGQDHLSLFRDLTFLEEVIEDLDARKIKSLDFAYAYAMEKLKGNL